MPYLILPTWDPGSSCSFIIVMSKSRSTETLPPRTLLKPRKEGWCLELALRPPLPTSMTQLWSFTVLDVRMLVQ